MSSVLNTIRLLPSSGIGVFYNAGYAIFAAVYAKWLAPIIMSSMENSPESEFYAPWLGVLIVATLILETPALLYKIRRNPFDKSKNKLIIVVICLHLVMVEYAAYYAFKAFGFAGGWSSIGLLLFIVPFFIRDMTVLFSFVQTRHEPEEARPFLKVFYNISLFLTGLILATVVWDTQLRIFGGLSELTETSTGHQGIIPAAGQLVTVLISCIIMFVPTRLGFMIEERTISENIERRVVGITFFLAALFGMLPYLQS